MFNQDTYARITESRYLHKERALLDKSTHTCELKDHRNIFMKQGILQRIFV